MQGLVRRMNVEITQPKVKVEIIKGMRWFFFCWIWMFASIIISPLLAPYTNIDGKAVPLIILYILILTMPYLMRWLDGWLDLVAQVAVITWVLALLVPSAHIVFQMACLPVIIFEELVLLGNLKRIPVVSVLYLLPSLIGQHDGLKLFLILEAIIAIAIISYAAYIGIGRRFNQAEELQRANRQLSQANKEIAQLTSQRVRQAVARDIHDTLTQDIVGINMQLTVMKLLAQKHDYERLGLILDKTSRMATEAIRESRELIQQYRSVDDENPQRSLKQALLRITHDMEDNYDLQTEITLDKDVLIHNSELHDIMQVVGEALMNVVKHAHSQQADVKVTLEDQLLTIRISDRGSQFNPSLTLKNHYGIKNMMERARKYGGKVMVNSLPNGVEVVAKFPIKEEEAWSTQ